MNAKLRERAFARYELPNLHAFISSDRIHYIRLDLYDISAGGMKFALPQIDFDPKFHSKFYFKLNINEMYANFKIITKGEIVRKERCSKSGRILYGVKFIDIKKYDQTRLDEALIDFKLI